MPNRYGGRENLEAVAFLSRSTPPVADEQPGVHHDRRRVHGVARRHQAGHRGGLGFTFKWNMGWMHDTLRVLRARTRSTAATITTCSPSAMMYEYSERFIMPLSHDEVVHLKGSLIAKMPGETGRGSPICARSSPTCRASRQEAALHGHRARAATEWNHDAASTGIWWACPRTQGLVRWSRSSAVYRHAELWRRDHEPTASRGSMPTTGALDATRSPAATANELSSSAQTHAGPARGLSHGAPPGAVSLLLSSDDTGYGGSGFAVPLEVQTEPIAWQRQEVSFRIVVSRLLGVRAARTRSRWRLSSVRGATPQADGRTHFAVWAPKAREVVRVEVRRAGRGRDASPASSRRDMACTKRARCRMSPPGSDYAYRLDGGPPRPYRSAVAPEGVHGPAPSSDPGGSRGSDTGWRGLPVADLLPDELHVGTFTPAGTFEADI